MIPCVVVYSYTCNEEKNAPVPTKGYECGDAYTRALAQLYSAMYTIEVPK